MTNAERIAQMMESTDGIGSALCRDLVTCGCCRWHVGGPVKDDGRVFCMILDRGMNEYDFCSYGEKKTKTGEMMTDKQREFIEEIQAYVRERFTGETKKEASEYIDRNIEEYKLKSADSWVYDHGYI